MSVGIKFASKVTLAMVSLDPASLGRWLDPLRPLHHRLIAPLGAIFRDKALPESQRLLSTSILADFAGDDPEALAGLLMDADAKAFASLFPAVEIVKDKAVPIFQKVVDEPASVGRKRSPVDPSWTTPGPGVTRPIESADGIVKDQFAFCQTMPLREFGVVDEGLRNLGYRMARFRPFLDGKVVRAAAIWNRDGLSTRFEPGQPAGDLSRMRRIEKTGSCDGCFGLRFTRRSGASEQPLLGDLGEGGRWSSGGRDAHWRAGGQVRQDQRKGRGRRNGSRPHSKSCSGARGMNCIAAFGVRLLDRPHRS